MIPRATRKLCAFIAALMLAAGAAAQSRAADIEKIHFLIPGGAGGGWDGTARGTGEALTKAGLVGQASYENMSGGGGGKAIAHIIETASRQSGTLMVNSTPIVLRSLRDALVAVSPSLLVVVWIYGFMHLVGMSVNVVTATIAAIAIGVGLDYSTHFTMRYREELRHAPSRVDAVRRAGTDTGGPLAISALSSIVGFGVMALAPMPIFATFGLLTAVRVLLSLAVSLFVLPSLLLVSAAVGARRAGRTGTGRPVPPPSVDVPAETSPEKEPIHA